MGHPTATRIVVLAATKMFGGMCVAGADSDAHWVRPVNPPGYSFSPQELSENGRVIVEPYNEIEFVAGERLGNPPETEDIKAIVSEQPHLVRTLDDGDTLALLRRMDEHDEVAVHAGELEHWLIGVERSLILTRADELLLAYRNAFNERRQRRIVFRVGQSILNLLCTDLRWRCITRNDKDAEALETLKRASDVYFALGLARPFQGHNYPMVVGVHPIPKLEARVDYNDL